MGPTLPFLNSFGGLGYPWKGHCLYFLSTLSLGGLVYYAVTVCPCSIAIYLWLIWDSIQPSVQFLFELICFNSRPVSYFSRYGIEESHHFASRTIMYYSGVFTFSTPFYSCIFYCSTH